MNNNATQSTNQTQQSALAGIASFGFGFGSPGNLSPFGSAFGQIIDSFLGQLSETLIAALRHEIGQNIASAGPTASDGEKLLGVDETAALLGICRQTVHDWKRRGLLEYHRLGGKVYFKQSEVVAALNRQTRPDGKRKGSRKNIKTQ